MVHVKLVPIMRKVKVNMSVVLIDVMGDRRYSLMEHVKTVPIIRECKVMMVRNVVKTLVLIEKG